MPRYEKVDEWRPGRPVSASKLNRLSDIANSVIDSTVDFPVVGDVDVDVTKFVFKATADEANSEITCKLVDSLGVVSGKTFTFKVLP